jgi:hypothetical protein
MQQIQSYLYPNTLAVQFQDPTIFAPRNRIVYSRPITVYQGIDNPIQVVVKNQDQKSVNLTGYTVTLDIQDPLLANTVASLPVTISNAAIGLGNVTVTSALLSTMDQRIYKIAIKATASGNSRPMYIDDNFGAKLDLDVKPGWY